MKLKFIYSENAQALVDLVHEIGILAHESADLMSMLKAICQRVLDITEASLATISLVDEELGESILTACATENPGSLPGELRKPVGEGVVGKVITSGEAVYLDDTTGVEGFVNLIPGMKSELAVPLVLKGRTIGVLNIESKHAGRFGGWERGVLQAISNPIALAVENTRLHLERNKRIQQLSMLNQMSREITSSVDSDTLLQRVTEAIRKHLDYTFVAVGMLNEENRVVLKGFSSVLPVTLPLGHSQALGEGVVGMAAERGESVLIRDITTLENYVPVHKDIRCEMAVPMIAGDRVVGYIDVEDIRERAFDKKDMQVLETVADHIAQAIANAENLKRTRQMKLDLSRMIVHDLRTPLSVVLSALEVLKPDNPEPSTGRLWKIALSACGELSTMLESFLELHKIEKGKMVLRREIMDPVDTVKMAVAVLRPQAQTLSRTLKFHADEPLPQVDADPDLLRRVVQNLVMNAFKFTPKEGEIRVTLSVAPGDMVSRRLGNGKKCLLLRVKDDGLGIPAGELEQVFDRFARLQTPDAKQRRGIGLGLTFCRLAVNEHGGAIWAESKEGEGSTFSVLIPAVEKNV